MLAVLVASTKLVRDAYSIDCALLALLSLFAAWRPTMPAKLFFMRSEVPLWAAKTFRFIALLCASGAILALLMRAVQKGG